MPQVVYHGWTHRPDWLGGSDPSRPLGFYEIKVFADANALDGLLPASATNVSVGDGKFIFAIPRDLDGTELVHAEAYVTSTGALVTVQIRRMRAAVADVDMLSTRITIDAGEYSSLNAISPPVINETNAEVDMADRIAIDVDTAGGKGLGVKLVFAAV
jgi:hypothetical protein